jgi:hypothetical protein
VSSSIASTVTGLDTMRDCKCPRKSSIVVGVFDAVSQAPS